MPVGVYPRKLRPVGERFMEKVSIDQETGCWNWMSGTSKAGYGQFSLNGGPIYAHRWSYENANGEIPNGLEIDHLCRNRACVNPAHLEAVTSAENTRRGMLRQVNEVTWKARREKTECQRGHPFDEENTKWDANGHRMCRECQTAAIREWKARNKDLVLERQRISRANKRKSA